MRGSLHRKRKYESKLKSEAIHKRMAEYGPAQKRAFRGAISGQVHIERAVKAILAQYGVSPIFNHYYMQFGKTINKLKNKFKGETLKTEAEILQTAWAKRGLDVAVLDAIKGWENIVGLPFRLDHSLLDGPDVLS